MKHADRPLEMLERQLAANRGAARYRNPQNGLRHFAHENVFRAAFVKDTLALRKAIREKK